MCQKLRGIFQVPQALERALVPRCAGAERPRPVRVQLLQPLLGHQAEGPQGPLGPEEPLQGNLRIQKIKPMLLYGSASSVL